MVIRRFSLDSIEYWLILRNQVFHKRSDGQQASCRELKTNVIKGVEVGKTTEGADREVVGRTIIRKNERCNIIHKAKMAHKTKREQ